MFDLGPGRKPVVAAKYKHLMPEDYRIWRRFCEVGDYLPEEVWYDVPVGKGVEVATAQPKWMKRFAEYATRKRIDIVGRWGLNYYIIEAKPHAGVVALGQVLYYGHAFRKQFNPAGDVIPAIVTDVCDEDVREVFDLAGVLVFEVGRGNWRLGGSRVDH